MPAAMRSRGASHPPRRHPDRWLSRRSGAAAAAWLVVLLTAAAAPAASLYVTNTRSDSLSIIDTGTFEVVDTIPLGRGKPNRIAFHPDGRTAWVIYDKSHDIGVIGVAERRVTRRVKIGGNPYNLAFTPDGRYLYVLDWSSETSRDEVIIYDLAAERIVGRIETSTWPAHGIFTRNGKVFYVSGETAGDLAVIDVASQTIRKTLMTGGDAMGLALSADERRLYAAGGEARMVFVVDAMTHEIAAEVPVPGIVHDAVLTPDGRFLYTTLRKKNRVAVVSTADHRVAATIPQPGYPDLVMMDPAGRHAFVTNRNAGVVTVINLATHETIKSIAVGQGPHGMALQPENGARVMRAPAPAAATPVAGQGGLP